MILVTGGTGFVGGAIVRALLKRGERVRVLARNPDKARALEAMGVDIAIGNLLDPSSLEVAMRDVNTLYHVAAIYELGGTVDEAEMRRTEIDGTRHILEAARKAGVRKIVYTSTVYTIGAAKGQIGTEATVHRGYYLNRYEKAKVDTEHLVLEYIRQGMPIVIVNPAGIYGPNDFKISGRSIITAIRGGYPAVCDMTWPVIYLDDAAEGHVLAAERGKIGERYILSERNLTTRAYLELLERFGGARTPPFVPPVFAMIFAALMDGIAMLTGKPSVLPVEQVRSIAHGMAVNGQKATRELGLQYTPIETWLPLTLQWYWENGHLPREPVMFQQA
jgi:dihydroflavonol-4-reductase